MRQDLQTSAELFTLFFSSRRRHTIFDCDWSSDVCSSDLHDLANLGLRGLATLVQYQNLLRGPEAPAGDAPDADAPHVARVIDVADLQLQRAVGIAFRRLNALDDRPEKRPHVRSRPRQVERSGAQ